MTVCKGSIDKLYAVYYTSDTNNNNNTCIDMLNVVCILHCSKTLLIMLSWHVLMCSLQKPYLPTMPRHEEEKTVDDLMANYYSELIISLSVL